MTEHTNFHSEIYPELKARKWQKIKYRIGTWFWVSAIILFVFAVIWCIAYGLAYPSYAAGPVKERIIKQNAEEWWIIKGEELNK